MLLDKGAITAGPEGELPADSWVVLSWAILSCSTAQA